MYSRAYESDKREPEEFLGAQRAERVYRLRHWFLCRAKINLRIISREENTRARTNTHPLVIEGEYFQNRRDQIENRLTSRDPTTDNRDFPSSEHRDVALPTLQSIAFV